MKTIAIKVAGTEDDPIDTQLYPGTTVREVLMKQIALKILGSESDPFEIFIMPGMRVKDILAALRLEGGCVLANHNRYFAEEEVLFDNVSDGDKLWVTYPCVYGRCAG